MSYRSANSPINYTSPTCFYAVTFSTAKPAPSSPRCPFVSRLRLFLAVYDVNISVPRTVIKWALAATRRGSLEDEYSCSFKVRLASLQRPPHQWRRYRPQRFNEIWSPRPLDLKLWLFLFCCCCCCCCERLGFYVSFSMFLWRHFLSSVVFFCCTYFFYIVYYFHNR